MSSAEMAVGYVRRLVEMETRGWGDQKDALKRVASRYRVPFWTLDRIRSGRAKTVDAGIFSRIREAFIDQCERSAARLLHDAEIEKAVNPHVHLDDLEDQIRALVARLENAKATAPRGGAQ